MTTRPGVAGGGGRRRQSPAMDRRLVIGIAALAGFVVCVLGANWFVENVGTQPGPGAPHTLPVGFGERAPSGFVWVGISLTLRDLLQRTLGARFTIAAIVAGAGLSALLNIDASLALASGVTFLFAELLDLSVYTPLQERNLGAAAIASNVVGAIVDSVIFLWLAFGWDTVADFAVWQALGKFEWSLLFLPLLFASRRALPQPAPA